MRLLLFLFLITLPSMYGFSRSHTDSMPVKAVSSLHTGALVPENTPPLYYNIPDRMKARHVNGLSIAVIDNGKIDFVKAYGVRDASKPDALVDSATLFQCASIGKMITALAALHLVKLGKITLDEPVNKKLINWKLPPANGLEEKVTLRHLLSHAAGLQDDYGFGGYPAHSSLPDLQQMLDSRGPANTKKKLIVMNEPGTAEKYSGGGYLVIQKLIEDCSGRPFALFVDSIIFKPLKMLHSTYEYYPDEVQEAAIARGHHGDGRIDKKRKYMVYPELAAAGFWTTPYDLALFVMQIQQEKKGLSAIIADSTLINEMLRPQINNTGLGTHLKGSKEVTAFWHAGNTAGYTGVLFGTLTGQGAIVLTNSDEGEWLTLEIIRSIADAYNWPSMQTQYIKETTTTDFDVYTGNYSKGSTKVLIGRDAKGTWLQTGDNTPRLILYQLKDGSFLIKEKPEHFRMFFNKDENGIVQSLQFQQNCGTATGTLNKIK